MKPVKLKSERLTTLLSSITDEFYSGVVKDLVFSLPEQKDKLNPNFHPCSDEYLFEAFKHPVSEYGFPRAVLGLGMNNASQQIWDKVESVRKKAARIGNFLGTPVNALIMSYPDNGYIGWHHNGNAPGYNVLLTYSQDGDGNFSYWDYNTKSIVRLQDQPGWNVRVGYYPNERKEPNRVFWHMAETKKQRVTLAWVMHNKDMWINMIKEITKGDCDPEIFNQ
jgi:hypothetical protein